MIIALIGAALTYAATYAIVNRYVEAAEVRRFILLTRAGFPFHRAKQIVGWA